METEEEVEEAEEEMEVMEVDLEEYLQLHIEGLPFKQNMEVSQKLSLYRSAI